MRWLVVFGSEQAGGFGVDVCDELVAAGHNVPIFAYPRIVVEDCFGRLEAP